VTPVALQSAINFAVFAKRGIVNNNTLFRGNVRVFNSLNGSVIGFVLKGDSTDPPVSADSIDETEADVQTAYNDARARNIGKSCNFNKQTTNMLGSGVYTCPTDIDFGENVYLHGNQTDVFIFQINGSLTLGRDVHVILEEGVSHHNVFWQIASTVTINQGVHMQGTVLVKGDAVFEAHSLLTGRLFTQSEAFFSNATITVESWACWFQRVRLGVGSRMPGC
jgi:hypothetical protein